MVYCIYRGQSFTIILHKMVFIGGYFEKIGGQGLISLTLPNFFPVEVRCSN